MVTKFEFKSVLLLKASGGESGAFLYPYPANRTSEKPELENEDAANRCPPENGGHL